MGGFITVNFDAGYNDAVLEVDLISFLTCSKEMTYV